MFIQGSIDLDQIHEDVVRLRRLFKAPLEEREARQARVRRWAEVAGVDRETGQVDLVAQVEAHEASER